MDSMDKAAGPTLPLAMVAGAVSGFWAGNSAWALLGGAATGLLIWAGWTLALAVVRDAREEDWFDDHSEGRY